MFGQLLATNHSILKVQKVVHSFADSDQKLKERKMKRKTLAGVPYTFFSIQFRKNLLFNYRRNQQLDIIHRMEYNSEIYGV